MNEVKKIAWKYGIISGLLIIIYSALTFIYFGDISKLTPEKFKLFELLGYLRYFILILTLLFALRSLKNSGSAIVSFRSLMKTGVLISLIIAIMTGVMEMANIWLNPDFFDQYGVMYINQLKSSGASETEIKQAMDSMQNYNIMKTPWASGLYYFFETAFIGNVVSLALATLLRPRNEQI